MAETILRIDRVTKVFHTKLTSVHALTDVSFEIGRGETVGIVGESGCGKTTLGRCIVRAIEASGGSVFYTGSGGRELDFLKAGRKEMKGIRKDIQMIFQDPYSSLDPRMTVFDIISEPLRANYPGIGRGEIERRVIDTAAKTGLNTTYLKRYPHAFSGGQRQRIGIARALILNPAIIVCDEAVSALDVSIQAQVINLLKSLQREMNLTYIFISHDLSVVEYISDRVGVMYLGKLVEYADTLELYSRPLHPYTEALLSAVPIADPDVEIQRLPLAGEIPNPANPPNGCYFHPRCAYADERCGQKAPEFRDIGNGHFTACHRCGELSLRGVRYD
jgi:peptide/nickel transport system ATP-binding protein